jgi:hypothetical protein
MIRLLIDNQHVLVQTPENNVLLFTRDVAHNCVRDEVGNCFRLDGARPVKLPGIPPLAWTHQPDAKYA